MAGHTASENLLRHANERTSASGAVCVSRIISASQSREGPSSAASHLYSSGVGTETFALHSSLHCLVEPVKLWLQLQVEPSSPRRVVDIVAFEVPSQIAQHKELEIVLLKSFCMYRAPRSADGRLLTECSRQAVRIQLFSSPASCSGFWKSNVWRCKLGRWPAEFE